MRLETYYSEPIIRVNYHFFQEKELYFMKLFNLIKCAIINKINCILARENSGIYKIKDESQNHRIDSGNNVVINQNLFL